MMGVKYSTDEFGIRTYSVYTDRYYFLVNGDQVKEIKEEFGVDKVYTDLDGLCSDPEVEFVYIASPNSLHFTHARLALEHGKHVICEKPFTTSREKAQLLVELILRLVAYLELSRRSAGFVEIDKLFEHIFVI